MQRANRKRSQRSIGKNVFQACQKKDLPPVFHFLKPRMVFVLIDIETQNEKVKLKVSGTWSQEQ